MNHEEIKKEQIREIPGDVREYSVTDDKVAVLVRKEGMMCSTK